MANQIIQLSDGTNNLYPRFPFETFQSTDDLDDIKRTTGAWCRSVINRPHGDYGHLFVCFNINSGYQVYYEYLSSGQGGIYVRLYSNNQWYPWHLIGGANAVDFSSQCTWGTGTGVSSAATRMIRGIYYPDSRIVHVELLIYGATSDIASSETLITIPSAYRPSVDKYMLMMLTTSAKETYPYRGTIYSTGGIRQTFGNTIRSISATIEYQI